jgi:hypothetical protein
MGFQNLINESDVTDFFEGKVVLQKQAGLDSTIFKINSNGALIEVKTSIYLAFNNNFFSPSKPYNILTPLTAIKILNGEIPLDEINTYPLSFYLSLRDSKKLRKEYAWKIKDKCKG